MSPMSAVVPLEGRFQNVMLVWSSNGMLTWFENVLLVWSVIRVDSTHTVQTSSKDGHISMPVCNK